MVCDLLGSHQNVQPPKFPKSDPAKTAMTANQFLQSLWFNTKIFTVDSFKIQSIAQSGRTSVCVLGGGYVESFHGHFSNSF